MDTARAAKGRFRRRIGDSWRGLVLALVVTGCASVPEEQVSPTEWLEQNSSILGDLESFEKERQQDAVARLRALGETRGRAVAVTVLREGRLDYRAEIVLARLLADWRDPEAVPHLLRYLRHEDRGAVELAREGLRVFADDPYVRKSLFEIVEGADPEARLAAAESLFAIDDHEVFEFCAKTYHRERDRFVRGALVMKFVSGRHPRRTEFLIEALSDPDGAIREAAWNALRKEPSLPRVEYSPAGEPAARARAVAALRRWAADRAR
jgi:hypothetical protein